MVKGVQHGTGVATLKAGVDVKRAAANSDEAGPARGQEEDGVAERVRLEQSSSRLAQLRNLDQGADKMLEANQAYQTGILAAMAQIANAVTRTEQVEVLLKDYATTLASGPNLVVVAAGTQQVTLPWFKHFYGQDLPPHPEGQARDVYLSTIRSVPWTHPERNSLRQEIMRSNQSMIADEARDADEDITARLATYDESYFVASVEGLDWDKIALVIPRRRGIECKIQWLQCDHPSINSSKWTAKEVSALAKVAEKRGCRDWARIAQDLGTQRTAADCLKQYRGRAGQRKPWSAVEDAKLVEAVHKFGENWQSVARHCGRHSNQCINRWTKTLRPTIQRGRWTAEEDALLLAAYAVCGTSWKLIAPRVGNRTDAQCRERYCNILDPNILDPRSWTQEEDENLLAWRTSGETWSQISVRFRSQRTDNHCMRRFLELNKRSAFAKAAESKAAAKASRGPRARKRAQAAEDLEEMIDGEPEPEGEREADAEGGGEESRTSPLPIMRRKKTAHSPGRASNLAEANVTTKAGQSHKRGKGKGKRARKVEEPDLYPDEPDRDNNDDEQGAVLPAIHAMLSLQRHSAATSSTVSVQGESPADQLAISSSLPVARSHGRPSKKLRLTADQRAANVVAEAVASPVTPAANNGIRSSGRRRILIGGDGLPL